jgi:hypothetical protein
MVYQIDEKTLKKIVTECVEELKHNEDFEKAYQKTVERNKGRLFEMAFPRKVYMSKIDGIAPQIIENICLIRHCVICSQTRYKTHWGKELKGFMETIMRCDIKGAKGWEAKEKTIREIWNYNDFFMPEKIEWVIRSKFKDEGFDVQGSVFLQVISDCINTFNNLIHILSVSNYEDIDKFINEISN